jgi:hypothetical protein
MRQSRTSGSVGGLGGNSQAYPTTCSERRGVAGSTISAYRTSKKGLESRGSAPAEERGVGDEVAGDERSGRGGGGAEGDIPPAKRRD